MRPAGGPGPLPAGCGLSDRAALAALLWAGSAWAGDLEVRVTDAGGKPVEDAVVAVYAMAGGAPPQPAPADIDQVGEQFVGRDYDPYFEWSDERIYCSELVWKVFDRGAGVRLGEQQTIADFDLSHPAVQAKVKELYGDNVPLDEVVISPVAIFDSGLLDTAYEN